MSETATRGVPAGRTAALARTLQAAGVRTKILGIVLALTLLLGLSVTWQVRLITRGVLEQELDLRGASMASDLASRAVDPLLLSDTFSLNELLIDTIAAHDDAEYAFVLDSGERVIAHTFGTAGFPAQLLTFGSAHEPRIFDSDLGRLHDFSAPILDGRAGTVRVGLTEERLRSMVAGVTLQMLLTTLAVAIVGIGAAVLLTRVLVKPIKDLVAATRRVGSGDLTARARLWASDEIGVLASAFNQMVEDLEASTATIAEKEAARSRLLDKLIDAQEEERKRIARELHDGVGQSLNSLVLGLSAMGRANGGQAAEADRLRGATLEALGAVRQLSRQLRPSVLDDLGLADALEVYASEVSALHPELQVDTHLSLDRRLPPSTEIAVYRMVQEGMTNAARHSRAGVLSVVLAQRDGHTTAIIEDDGIGFDVEAMRRRAQSVGIHAIHERAELVGGRARIESGPGGTTVFIEVPG